MEVNLKRKRPILALPTAEKEPQECNDRDALLPEQSPNTPVSADAEEKQRADLQKMGDLWQRLGHLDQNVMDTLQQLGVGSGGVVSKVRYRPSGTILACKRIRLEVSPALRVRISRELEIIRNCDSPFIIRYYGTFCREEDVVIFTEFMDGGSLDQIVKTGIRVPEPMLGGIGLSVLRGVEYLKEKHKLVHRDIKPSNILVNSHGKVKLCDFGVSGQLVESRANSFVGSRSYMAPERFEGDSYSVQSDIWSLALSLTELVLARYPIPQLTEEDFETIFLSDTTPPVPDTHFSFFDLLVHVCQSPPPTLPQRWISPSLKQLLDSCLQRIPAQRPTLDSLLRHPFIVKAEQADVDFSGWICQVKHLPRPKPNR